MFCTSMICESLPFLLSPLPELMWSTSALYKVINFCQCCPTFRSSILYSTYVSSPTGISAQPRNPTCWESRSFFDIRFMTDADGLSQLAWFKSCTSPYATPNSTPRNWIWLPNPILSSTKLQSYNAMLTMVRLCQWVPSRFATQNHFETSSPATVEYSRSHLSPSSADAELCLSSSWFPS
jgi:hypothetical protein